MKILSALILLSASCGTMITPAAIEESEAIDPEIKSSYLLRWREAVDLANQFLASNRRKTLPFGHYTFDKEGMHFVTDEQTWPVEVWNTTWGDLVVCFGFAAQEREFGFVVGTRGEGSDLIANSFFLDPNGQLRRDWRMAKLILHETTHMVFREGTVGFWNGLWYYLEAIFTLSSSNHSAEDLPKKTDREFARFYTQDLHQKP